MNLQDEKLPKSNYTKSFQLDTRSAEEITEDDLALVAVHVSEKRYDSIYVSRNQSVRDHSEIVSERSMDN